MGLLDYDLLVIGGGGGGVVRAKILAPCISCNVKAIFMVSVGGDVTVLPLRPRLVLVSFSSQASVARGKQLDARMDLVAMTTNMFTEMGSLARAAFFWAVSIMLM